MALSPESDKNAMDAFDAAISGNVFGRPGKRNDIAGFLSELGDRELVELLDVLDLMRSVAQDELQGR